jgi:sphinganine-1-phosphate aldolase
MPTKLPKKGLKPEKVFKLLHAAKREDANWKRGRTWSLVYHAGEKHKEQLLDVYKMFFAENALSPAAFPSLGKLEKDIVSICAKLLNGGQDVAGTMTSGGTESILLAVKAHRDWFHSRHPQIRRPQIVIPASAHPAFYKAAHYFNLKPVTVPLNSKFRVDAAEIARAISKKTALLVASAPSYPYGIVDPISELGKIAQQKKLGLHVDACLGGAFLPFMQKLGHKIPPFDFSVPGVTSISADLHKYGFAPKGASVILYRNRDLRRFQFFTQPDWLGGAYASPAMLGTRSGGVLAASWAGLMLLGENGYVQLVKKTLQLRDKLFEGIKSAGFEIVGQPDMSVFCFTSNKLDIFSVADALEKKGWRIDRQKTPPSIHMIVTVNHAQSVNAFVRDLKSVAAEEIKSGGRKRRRSVSLYGVTNKSFASRDPVKALYRAIESVYD